MGASIVLENIAIQFKSRGHLIDVVAGISASIPGGASLAITGPSGSGKSSLLNVMSGLVRPARGSVVVGDVRVDQLNVAEACDLRRGYIGFVFQAFHLLPHLTAAENVRLGAEISGCSAKEADALARLALHEVGLDHRGSHRPAELSGGEQQRVALARAFAAQPQLILADEPTGNLDPAAAELVSSLLEHLRVLMNATVVIATHSAELANVAQQQLVLTGANIVPLPADARLRRPDAANA
jgi:putative ABC transport system ATP-binding protein